ncbi:MAG TPA: hypothetical protein VKV15_25935 [Bryobacteraceae bacterium]|jgi:hypothetical protein|nr:hypothetical protein [Bryobacteraceae bacterium]
MPTATRTRQTASRITKAENVTINYPQPETPVTVEPPKKKDFWEEQQILNTPEGKDYVIYLTRLNPVLPGMKGYIAKYSSPVTIEEIQESFGGYEYRISLHKGSKWICSDIFSIAAPPKAAGVADPNLLGLTGQPAGGANDSTVRQILEFVDKRLEEEKKNKASDPAFISSLELVRESAKQAIAAAYSQSRNPAAETMQTQMMSMMMTSMNNIMTALLQRGLERPETGGVAGLREMLGLVKELSTGGVPGTGKVDALTAIGQTLVNAAPQILQAGAQFMEKYHAIARERTVQTQLQYNAIALQRGAAVAPPAQTIETLPPAQPVQPAVTPFPTVDFSPGTPATTSSTSPEQGSPSMDWLKGRIVALIANGMSGEGLFDFIKGVDENFARTLLTISADQIRAFMAGDPILSKAVTLPNFDQVLGELMEYMHPDGEPQTVTPN